LSDDRPLALPGERVRVQPSAIELIDQCGLRWMLERHGGSEPSGISQQVGNLVHAAAEEAARRPDADPETVMREFIDAHAGLLPYESPWRQRQEREDLRTMTSNYLAWLRGNDRELVAVETEFRVKLPEHPPGVTVELSGKVDRLERDALGGLHVVDLKTGKSKPSLKEAAANPQLAAYQLAVQQGGFAGVSDSLVAAGASLVFVRDGNRATGASVREQEPPGAEGADEARQKVLRAAQSMTKSAFLAVHSDKCGSCAVKQCCPISGKGRTVTD
ncbi:MAG: RecB family exonuclease, partial [Stackebrandtia sp.]